MTEELKKFIEELNAGYMDDPHESARELARLDNLCKKASELIASNEKELNKISKQVEYLNKDPFRVLNKINVNEHTEKKGNLTYLSWAWAWQMLMELYPESYTELRRSPTGLPYWTDGKTCWVEVSVTIVWDGGKRTREEVFPIMDNRNNSVPVDKVTSFNVNTALQRAWTKCIARHGLGFYIYAGEDLPSEEAEEKKQQEEQNIVAEQSKQNTQMSESKPKIYYPAQMAIELTSLRNDIAKTGVDVHSDVFVNFVKDNAHVDTIDPGMLLNDPPAMNRVIQVMRMIKQQKA